MNESDTRATDRTPSGVIFIDQNPFNFKVGQETSTCTWFLLLLVLNVHSTQYVYWSYQCSPDT